MTDYLVDTAVFAYALGGPHAQRRPCRRIVERAAAGELHLHASVEMVQELLHHRMRRTDRAAAVQQARDAGNLCTLHSFGQAVLERALTLVGGTTLRGRDAVHAATAINHGLGAILTPDADFDDIAELVRVSPDALT